MKKGELRDPRSTGRKRARAVLWKLFEEGIKPFRCNSCGSTPEGCSDDGWTVDSSRLNRSNNLDANHINKNWLDNDPANLEWLCRVCHREKDRRTEKGVSALGDEYGYGLDFIN